jgi:hypothetical protein
MRILGVVYNKNLDGVLFHRIFNPMALLFKNHNCKIQFVDYVDEKSDFTSYDIVLVSRFFRSKPLSKRFQIAVANKIKLDGAKLVVDCDDSIFVNATHLHKKAFEELNITEINAAAVSLADFVTTTTHTLQKELLKYNKNVFVLPNTIQDTDFVKTPSDKVRFGYLGSAFHLEDIKLLTGVFEKVKGNFELVLLKPINSVFEKYAQILTNNGKVPHRFVEPKSPFEYLTLYNEIDYSLIPLVNNSFNRKKSPLKLIECAITRTEAIVSNTLPYSPYINASNSFIIPDRKEEIIKMIQSIVQDKPTKVSKLREVYKDKFNPNDITKERFNVFDSFQQEDKPIINIVTPLTRVENLQVIANSIPKSPQIRWWVIQEKKLLPTIVDLPIEVWQKIYHYEIIEGGDWGHTQRNYVLDRVADEEFFFSLDDDTILHPNFLNTINKYNCSITFSQIQPNGYIREGNNIKVGFIDNGQFCLKKSDIGKVRFTKEYEADGLFIQKFKNIVKIVPDVAAYYNYLRK